MRVHITGEDGSAEVHLTFKERSLVAEVLDHAPWLSDEDQRVVQQLVAALHPGDRTNTSALEHDHQGGKS
jgi:hypothetical protein